MEEKDLRFKRTKRNILKAMTHLLKRNNFEDITVTAICKEAEISRSGFYLHYIDKYDLVEKYQLELMKIATDIFRSNVKKGKHEVMREMLYFFKNDAQLFSLLIAKHGSPEIKENIKAIIKANAKQNILPYLKLTIHNEIQERYVLTFYANAVFGILQEWIDSGQKESPEEIVAILEEIVFLEFIE